MRHGVGGTKLSRTYDERRRLLRGLVGELIVHDKIVTTRAKAKAIQPLVEKLISKIKKGDNASARVVQSSLVDGAIIKRFTAWGKSRFASRTSGFTRIVRLGFGRGDKRELVQLSFVDALPQLEAKKAPVNKSKPAKSESKVQEAEIVSLKPKRTPKAKK